MVGCGRCAVAVNCNQQMYVIWHYHIIQDFGRREMKRNFVNHVLGNLATFVQIHFAPVYFSEKVPFFGTADCDEVHSAIVVMPFCAELVSVCHCKKCFFDADAPLARPYTFVTVILRFIRQMCHGVRTALFHSPLRRWLGWVRRRRRSEARRHWARSLTHRGEGCEDRSLARGSTKEVRGTVSPNCSG